MLSASHTALVGAVGAVVGWTAKAIAIGLAGGLDRSPAEGPLFLVGLAFALVGAGAFGAALTADKSLALRVLAGTAMILGLVLVTGVGGAVAVAAQPDDPSWVWGEINLWVSALALLAAVLVWRSGRSRPATG